MRHVRMLGLCVAAVFMVSAVVAASASAALPEFGGCEAAAKTEKENHKTHVTTVMWHGKYENAECTNPNQPEGKALKGQEKNEKGRYEWYTGEKFGTVWTKERGRETPYGLEQSLEWEFGPVTFETAAGKTITCHLGNPHEFEGGYGELHLLNKHPNEVNEGRFELQNCESEGKPCYSQPYEDVNNRDEWYYEGGFEGKLGYISGKGTEHPVVGLSLTTPKNEEGKPVPLLIANCEGPVGTIVIGGKLKKNEGNAMIAVVTPVDEMTPGVTLAWNESHGVQEPAKFETGKNLLLQAEVGGVWESIGLQAEVSVPFGGPKIEIKAIP